MKPTNMGVRLGGIAATTALIVVGAAFAHGRSTPPRSSPVLSMLAKMPHDNSLYRKRPTDTPADFWRRLRVAQARYSWTGEIHHQAVTDFMSDEGQGGTGAGYATRHCNTARSIAEKYIPAVQAASGTQLDRQDLTDRINGALSNHEECAGVHSQSVFARRSMNLPTRARSPFDGTDFSGNLDYYWPAIEGALSAWDGSTDLSSDVDAAMQGIGYQYFLTDDDLAFLSGMISTETGSAYDWAAYPSYVDGEEFDIMDGPHSIFSPRSFGLWRWLKKRH